MSYSDFSDKALNGIALTREECCRVLSCPDCDVLGLVAQAYRVRRAYFGDRVSIQVLSNAKSGLCPEDCHYCSQSRISTAPIERYPLVSKEVLLSEARRARDCGAVRFCMALSGKAPSESELEQLCDTVSAIKEEVGSLSLCGSLGFVTREQAARLRAAGLDRINHNLNTSRSFHANICTTHSYEDRVATIRNAKAEGLEVCSGGIIGQGETDEDIVDLFLALRELGPQAVPVNFLIPVEGTPFGERDTGLTPWRCLKVLCLARFLHPDREVRAAGGREYHLRSLQPLALMVIDSIFVSGYLTTGGQGLADARAMIEDLGFACAIEGAELDRGLSASV